jgi:hypothetical protein
MVLLKRHERMRAGQTRAGSGTRPGVAIGPVSTRLELSTAAAAWMRTRVSRPARLSFDSFALHRGARDTLGMLSFPFSAAIPNPGLLQLRPRPLAELDIRGWTLRGGNVSIDPSEQSRRTCCRGSYQLVRPSVRYCAGNRCRRFGLGARHVVSCCQSYGA